jgi:methylated-DNA-protein-cysteine methyltransferase-like protein
MSDESERGLYERIYRVVAQVPRGMVATYGDIAAIVGGCDARTVGYALNEIPKRREGDMPWQRIINSQGGISTRGVRQRELLEAEGIAFDARDRVPLARYRWPGPSAEDAAAQGLNALPAADADDGAEQLRLF